MELQEPVVQALICQLKFRLRPRFADVRGQLIETLAAEFDLAEYGWGEAGVEVWQQDRSLTLIAAGRELRAQFGRVDSLDGVVRLTRDFQTLAGGLLAVTDVDFVGVRTQWMAAVDSFEQLKDALVNGMTPAAQTFLAPFGAGVTDAGWSFELKEKDPKWSLRFGPMNRDQAVQHFIPQERHDDLPIDFLWLDVDRVRNDDAMPFDDAVATSESAIRKNVEFSNRLLSSLMDQLASID